MPQLKLAANDPMPEAKNLKKRTMVKDVVGQVRATTYIIPESDFTYGIKNDWNVMGADVVVSNWAVGQKSKSQTTMKSFPATNREALKTGILTAKGQREYAKKNPVMKANPTGAVDNTKEKDSKAWSHGRPFGIKSTQNTTPMSLILSAPDDGVERDYPVYSSQQKGGMPKPRPTKSSQLAEASNAKKNEPPGSPVDEFKMKKFANVKAKVVMGK